MRPARRRWPVVVVALVLLAVSAACALAIGAVSVPVPRVGEVVLRRIGLGDYDVTLLEDQVVWQLRAPRVLGAAAVGGVLACCGAVLQSLTRNALADPYLLGISNGAAMGAVTVIVLGVGIAGVAGTAAVTAAAFIGALLSMGLVLALAASRGTLSPGRTVLAGVAVGHAGAAYTSMIVILGGDSDAARRVLSWTLGSLAGLRWDSACFLIIVAAVAVLFFAMFADQLDAFAFGETAAQSLGVAVNRVRWTLMTATALATAGMVAYVGVIGFVGLVVPHVVRMVIGAGHRGLLPLSALAGATLLIWADTLARSMVADQEVPVGAVTALVGVPFFVWLLRRTERAS